LALAAKLNDLEEPARTRGTVAGFGAARREDCLLGPNARLEICPLGREVSPQAIFDLPPRAAGTGTAVDVW
jgi:hypothetical protein